MLFSLIVIIAFASIALGKLHQQPAALDSIQQRFKAFETKHAMIKAKDWKGLANIARSNPKLAAASQWFQIGQCPSTAIQDWTYIPLGICIPEDSTSTTFVQYQSTTANVLSFTIYSDSACSVTVISSSQIFQNPSICSTAVSTPTGIVVSALSGNVGAAYFASSDACNANTPEFINLLQAGCQSLNDDGTSTIATCSGSSVTVQTFDSSTTCSGSSTTTTVQNSDVFSQLGFATSCSQVNDTTPLLVCNEPTSSSSSSSSSCFAGSETVQLKNGETKLISQVKMGDNVLAYNPSSHSFLYSEVVSIPHAPNSQHATFVHLETVEGMSVKMTPEHLLPAGVCGSSSFPLLKAADVELGSCVQTMNGEQKIVSNTQEQGQGIYTIVTGEEYVVVNGIVASPFAVSHYVPNAYYNFHRLAYKTFPESMKTIAFDLLGAFAALFSVVSK